jgi:hypothetical protein
MAVKGWFASQGMDELLAEQKRVEPEYRIVTPGS